MANDLATTNGDNGNGTNDLIDQLLMLMIKRLDESLDDSIEKAVAGPLGEVKDSQKELEERVEQLEIKVTLDDDEQCQIHNEADFRIKWLLQNENEANIDKYRPQFYASLYHDLNAHFHVGRYSRIKRTDFNAAKNFVRNWEPIGGVQGLKSWVDRRKNRKGK